MVCLELDRCDELAVCAGFPRCPVREAAQMIAKGWGHVNDDGGLR
jgi:hypothetical protein